MNLCKFCGRQVPLVKAHIIPESMYPLEEVRREPLAIIHSDPNAPHGKSWIGEYDSTLVCAGCETMFSPWDDYAIRIFRQEPTKNNYLYIDGEPSLYTLDIYDYKKLKLFFVSLLWRAAESNRPPFANVNIGAKHTARLKRMIENEDPGDAEDYSVYIVRFMHRDGFHKAVMTPQRQRRGDDRVSFWHFYLAGYKCGIKVDQRPTPSPFVKMILRPNEPLRVVVMNFNETQEYKAVVSAARNLRSDSAK
jgi:hypothetical protein